MKLIETLNKRRIIKIVKFSIFFIVASVFIISSISAYRLRKNFDENETISLGADNISNISMPLETINETFAPAATPRKSYIPGPDELLELPILSTIEIETDTLIGAVEEQLLTITWEINEESDYYVLCAIDKDNSIYHKEILWASISEWMIPDIKNGDVYLFCYKDMGEDSSDDDILVATHSLSIQIESEVDVEETPKKTPKPSEPPSEDIKNKYYIIVDKSDCSFAAFTYDENDEYTIKVKTFPCAIGRSSRTTPNGTFKISSKGAWKDWGTGSYSPYYTKFTSGLYIHGAIYSSKTHDSLRAYSYEQIGTAVSGGCLRTTYEAAKWVYYNCPSGTNIKIVNSISSVNKVTRPNIDLDFPAWDPTDPEKPGTEPPSVPTIVTNRRLSLAEGHFESLATHIVAEDEDVDSAYLEYTITTMPKYGSLSITSFTQSQLDNGEVIYEHGGSNTTSDSFVFIVSNGSRATSNQTFSITIDSIDDSPPEIVVNNVLEVIRGESKSLASLLAASDFDAGPSEIQYTITSLPAHGEIFTSFTQADISAGNITYIHDGTSASSDTFTFSISDGINVVNNQVFSIRILDKPEADPTAEVTPDATDEEAADPTPDPTTESLPEQ